MSTYTIFIGGIAWDECRAWTIKQAQQIAEDRYSDRIVGSVWVRIASRRELVA